MDDVARQGMGQRRNLGARSCGLVAGVLAAALVAPPSSMAGEQQAKPTHLSVVIIADSVRIAGPNTFWAQLTESEPYAPVPNATVELWVKKYGEEEFHLARSGVTDELGELSLTIRVMRNIRTKWKFQGTPTHLPSVSPVQDERISPRVSIQVSDRTPNVGQRVVFTGATTPDRPGKRVSVFRGHTARGGFGPPYPPPVLLARGRIRADGTYRLIATFANPGRKTVFVQVAPGDGNITGWSRYRRIDVG